MVAYDNRYSAPRDRFRVAWSAELQSDGWLNEAGTRTDNDKKINSVTTAGTTKLGELGEVVTGIRGEHSGVPGTYSCTPTVGYACAVRFADGNHFIGGATENNNVIQGANFAIWRFKPDNLEDRVKSDDDNAHVSYGYWIRKGADGTWDVSPFPNSIRGEERSVDSAKKLNEDTQLQGTATYGGGAVGVYALSAEAGTFTADAELVADFTGNSVTGTIDGFMTKGFTGGDGTSRDDWSVELRKVLIGDHGVFTAEGASGLTRWTMDGTAALAAGRWQGAFYDRGGAGLLPKAATGCSSPSTA